jgi:hypothetical protein
MRFIKQVCRHEGSGTQIMYGITAGATWSSGS